LGLKNKFHFSYSKIWYKYGKSKWNKPTSALKSYTS